jgi:hypothetical protein
MIPAYITAKLAAHWRWFALIGAALAVFIGFQLIQAQRDEARQQFEMAEAKRNMTLAQLAVSNASIQALEGEVDEQNKAVEQLRIDGDKKRADAVAALVAEVKKGAAAVATGIKLRDAPQVGGDQAKSSATVLANRNLL